MKKFNYHQAFSRNIGWITEVEQQQLRIKKIAIAGMGGVGGFHLLTLVRLGIENFHIADFDEFEIHNFNRQIGASMRTLDRNKAATLCEMAKDINPSVKIKIFSDGVNANNCSEFLSGVDLYVDGLDFFVPNTRELIFKRCHDHKIPAITAGPIGMGTAYLIFMPDGMSFEDYFQFDGLSEQEKYINFSIGITPHMLPIKYLVDPLSASLIEKRGPSTVMACELCAGVIGTEALKILLKRGHVYPVPYYHFFDAYYGRFIRRKLWLGNRNPLQHIKRYIITKLVGKPKDKKPTVYSFDNPPNEMTKILDLSRWAPSADNSQPWRFNIIDESNSKVVMSTRPSNKMLDVNGFTLALTGGMLLECIRLSATLYRRKLNWHLVPSTNPDEYTIDINLIKDKEVLPDALSDFIPYRTTNRHRYKNERLNPDIKAELSKVLDNEYELIWFETAAQRWHFSRLNMLLTRIRLRLPELLETHQSIFDSSHFSVSAMPIESIGLNPLSLKLMLWAMKDKSRLDFLIKYFGADILTGLELDLIPGIFCGAHFAILTQDIQVVDLTTHKIIEAGMMLQRFWLSLTKMGLVMHPGYATVIFSYHFNHNIEFTQSAKVIKMAGDLNHEYSRYFDTKRLIFMGRVGYAANPKAISRSVRLPLSNLLINKD